MKPVLLILVGLAIVVMVFLLMKKKRQERDRAAATPPPDLANLSITAAHKGDVISIANATAEYDDLEFKADRRNRYESGGESWFELGGKWRERRVFVEAYEDDELEISFCFADDTVSLAELGLTEDDLARMDESQSRREGFEYKGQRFSYAGSGEIGYFKDGTGEGEGFYAWDFVGADDRTSITIEKWEDEPFEGTISRHIPEADVKVFRSA